MPRLVETKHIKHRILRVGNGAFFCSLKYISSTLRFAPEGLFFCRRAVWSGGFFHFTFPGPGGYGSSTKTPKRSHIWPTEIRIPAAAKVSIREVVDILGFALAMAKWDVWDARDEWDNGFLKFAFGASRWNLANHRQRASRRNQNRRIQCNRQGASRRI